MDSQPLPVVDLHISKRMVDAIRHRGPDDDGLFSNQKVWLGFSRLSIIDIANGRQPICNEDGSIISVCNGEIYNYKELRQQLLLKGHKFQTTCDVEVLVHLYEDYGVHFLDKLNGQFAFALYDSKKNTLILARDHVGICPLFFTITDQKLIFASEIKSILEYPGVSRRVNLQGLDQIFCLPGLCSPTTMFNDIHALKPGHFLRLENGQLNEWQYWDLDYPKDEPQVRSEQFYTEKLHDLLLKSVKYRLMQMCQSAYI